MRLLRTLLDWFFWRKDEDGEWQHRLWREHNGEPAFSTLWANYQSETHDDELTWGATWTHWGLGVDVEQGWEEIWIHQTRSRVSCRRWFAGIHLGPYSLVYQRVRPRRVAEVEHTS